MTDLTFTAANRDRHLTHLRYLENIAKALLVGDRIPTYPVTYPSFHMKVSGFVEPKERARVGKGGHHYTPKDTREFEAKVRDAAKIAMRDRKLARFECPVVVHLQIYDKIPPDMPEWKVSLAKAGIYFETSGGDLDNKEKAVLDALNKVVYRDDRLVVQNYKFRRFNQGAGFEIDIAPHGLTKGDLENIEKMLEYGQANAKKETASRITG